MKCCLSQLVSSATRYLSAILTLILLTNPALAQNQSMFQGFWTYCVEQVRQDSYVSREDLFPFTDDQIIELARNLNFMAIPEAIWASADGAWMVIDMDLEEPRNCSVASVFAPIDNNLIEWKARIEDSGDFGFRGVADVNGNRAGGWATTPVDDGFVQVSLNNIVFSTDPFASVSLLVAIRVGMTPASCELFPHECR